MKASKSRRAAPVRIVAVAAPIGWDKMFKKDPEGPEIQAFLDAALAQADASPHSDPKRANTTRRRANGGSGASGVGPAASAPTKKPRNASVKRDATAEVVKSRQERQKKK